MISFSSFLSLHLTFLIRLLAVRKNQGIIYMLVNVLRPFFNLDAIGGVYYSYWCCGTLLGCSFAAYATYSLYHAMLPEFRPRLHSTIAFACAYTVSYAYFFAEHLRNVVYLFSNFFTLSYFGHDRTMWHHKLLPIATTILLTIGISFSVWWQATARARAAASGDATDALSVAAALSHSAPPVAAPDTFRQRGRSSSPRRIIDRLPSWIVQRGTGEDCVDESNGRLSFQSTATLLNVKGGATPLLASSIDM